MKKMLCRLALPVLCSVFFIYCNNKEKKQYAPDLTKAIMELPEKHQPDSAILMSDPIELHLAEKAIMAYRTNEALLTEAIKNRSFGVAHTKTKLENYPVNFLTDFIKTRSIAANPTNGYTWQVGFAFGIARIENKPVLNIYTLPVLVKGTKIVDYFQLQAAGSQDAKLYWRDVISSQGRKPEPPDSAFVYDEGALWP
ncbi:MAG: hypothetical protein ABS85_09530 [Sphingobacteriales bacterium SCN 48-20]|uniref:hypothetical protein n=1 Tax=Terrimonas ferruginea TaxID=249 RepID=UPI000868A00F|nr:hypothetical protein [Terrimonas ferruginea]MBN8781470.1 hypothetical protein [Terrimonas ferruginea]ODT92455.1 MAG: hypothetical protein ABS85_09530 [Sphingobacteriales bacterium SCN 48-20]OJW44635.1 MAG: hypothetical protein BGO56_14310 [Sphingobacteriales bacterium 48-107]